jgi:hypothetical protein
MHLYGLIGKNAVRLRTKELHNTLQNYPSQIYNHLMCRSPLCMLCCFLFLPFLNHQSQLQAHRL